MAVRPDPRPAVALEEWQRSAACYDRPDLMHPPEDERTVWAQGAALALCGRCPVLDDCRDWVLALPASLDPDGITGGMTADERQAMRRRRGQHRRIAQEARPAAPADGKTCLDCGRHLPFDQFHVDRSRPDGRSIYCKPCKRAEVNARNRRRREGAA